MYTVYSYSLYYTCFIIHENVDEVVAAAFDLEQVLPTDAFFQKA